MPYEGNKDASGSGPIMLEVPGVELLWHLAPLVEDLEGVIL